MAEINTYLNQKKKKNRRTNNNIVLFSFSSDLFFLLLNSKYALYDPLGFFTFPSYFPTCDHLSATLLKSMFNTMFCVSFSLLIPSQWFHNKISVTKTKKKITPAGKNKDIYSSTLQDSKNFPRKKCKVFWQPLSVYRGKGDSPKSSTGASDLSDSWVFSLLSWPHWLHLSQVPLLFFSDSLLCSPFKQSEMGASNSFHGLSRMS